jgi:ATP-binding cassette, subfamily C (CFTR/MRP), member 1
MGQYQQMTYRAITMARGGLVSMLYGKTTEVSSTAVDATASLTLMNADIERIYTGWQTMHEIWANTIEIGIAMFLLERQLGIACTIPIGVALISLLGSLGATSLVMARQALWLQAIERRIGATSAALAAMKGVKMCGLTDSLLKNLHQLRVDEMRIARKFRLLLIWNLAFGEWLLRSPAHAP